MLNMARFLVALLNPPLLSAVRTQVSDWRLEPNEAASSMLASRWGCDPAQEKAILQEVLLKLGYASEVPDHYCSWARARCALRKGDPERNCVHTLKLPHQNLTGTVPRELGKLRSLRHLYLHGNPKLAGNLQHLQHLTRLLTLSLDHTAITGKLEDLQNLKLQQLQLDNTAISGKLSDLRHLTTLTRLSLDHTAISGKLEDLQNLRQLEWLHLDHTEITGTLRLQKQKDLETLSLKHTKITGKLEGLQAMPKLDILDLTGTGVSGDIGALLRFKKLQEARLAGTEVTGRVTKKWTRGGFNTRGKLHKLPNLEILDLTGSKAGFLPDEVMKFFLPALMHLSVSGCPVDRPADGLLDLLSICGRLARVDAVGCNLTGNLKGSAGQLQVLDLSRNRIEEIGQIPAASVLVLAENELPLRFRPGLLTQAVEGGIRLDLRGADLADTEELSEILRQGKVSPTPKLVADDADRGFSCYGLKDAPLDITPSLILPELCGCLPGWKGNQTACQKCGPGSYNREFNQTECTACPKNSSHEDHGAVTLQSCRCDVGRIFDDGHGNARCMCEAHTALFRGSCTDCGELHLECPKHGSRAETARPQKGYARLELGAPDASRCLQEEHCSDDMNSSVLGCTPGRAGPLCITCAENFRSSAGECTECGKAARIERWAIAVAAALLLAAAGSVVAWRRRRADGNAPSPTAPPSIRDALGPLLLAQGPVLLQLLQLWGVLAALQDSGGGRTEKVEWDQEIVQWLQFTASGVRDALSLECIDGRLARRVGAFASPCLPLLLLALCGLVEALVKSQGVSLALKVLSVFFIGGASSCAKLLQCQRVDGGGSPLGGFAFWSALPHLRCSDSHEEALWAYYIGCGCFASYSLLIPSFLIYLIVRQKKVMTPLDRFVCTAKADREKRNFQVSALLSLEEDESTRAAVQDKKDAEEVMVAQYLMASSLAYSAIYLHGRVRLLRTADTMKLEQIGSDLEASDESQLDVTSMISLLDQSDAHMSRCRALTRMLAERQVLEQEKSDRILMGAKEIFFKYATCENVWLEVALKLISGAVVVVVAIKSLMMTLLFTMGTAILLGYQKPYRQHQVNDLQSCCFFCLSVSAVGFAVSQLWLARCALAVPFALAVAQLLFPDGPEALALRLFEAATLSSPVTKSGKEAASVRWPELRPGDSLELFVKPVGISFW